MRKALCDTIFFNGKIVTVDDDFSVAEAVAIGGGKFLKVGRDADVRNLADPDTNEIDLKGKMVVPGFIDTHPHVINNGEKNATHLPIEGLQSIEAIKKRIAGKIENTPPKEWIVTTPIGDPPYHWHVPDILQEKRWPTRWELDEVSPNNPVLIEISAGSTNPISLNSYGLKLLGVTKDTPDEEQGIKVVKDSGTGEPNGQLYGMNRFAVNPLYSKLKAMLPRPTLEQATDGWKAAVKAYNSAGVTTGYEGHGTTSENVLPCKELWSRNELTMRICFAYEVDTKRSIDELESWIKGLAYATGPGFGDDRLKICGITVSVDGPAIYGAALINKPYRDILGKPAKGVQKVTGEKLKQIAFLAARNNLRLNIQAAGDRAIDIALEVCEEVNREIPIKGRRWVLIHVQFPSQENINKCKELGIAITTSSNFGYGEGAHITEKVGGDYCARHVPLRWWLDAGVVVTQSTDGGYFQPMSIVWQSLKRIYGKTGESLMTPCKEITREEALRIYTINGARLLFWEDKLGSIEAGKLADMVVLDNDILTCKLDDIKETRVLLTMVGGEVVYEGDKGA